MEYSRAKGPLGFVALPNIVIFQILLPLVSPLIDIMFAFGTIWYFIQKHFHPDSTDPASFHKLVAFFFVFLVVDFLASALAFALERRRPDEKEDVWLLSQVWLQRFAYRQLFSVVLFKTLKRALEGRKFAWDKLERTAAVKCVASEDRESGECAVAERGFSDLIYRNNNCANSARFRRQTIQVCIPGVSISVIFTSLVLSHSRRLRLIVIR